MRSLFRGYSTSIHDAALGKPNQFLRRKEFAVKLLAPPSWFYTKAEIIVLVNCTILSPVHSLGQIQFLETAEQLQTSLLGFWARAIRSNEALH